MKMTMAVCNALSVVLLKDQSSYCFMLEVSLTMK